jgi:hypothetical protein
MVKRLFVFVFILFLFFTGLIHADYLFNVEKQTVHLWINKDGSLDILYYITFVNSQIGKTIDIVDIGLPFNNYRLKTAKASIDGHNLYIRESEYIPTGVEIHLGSRSIPPGGRGELRFSINQPEMIFEDDVDENYASVEFLTNFFGDKFTEGATYLEIFLYFPVGVKPEEPRYHKDEFTGTGYSPDNRFYYYWRNQAADAALAYHVGASFPRKYVNDDAVKKVTIFTRIGLFFGNIFRNLVPEPLIFPCLFPWGIIIFFVIIGIFKSKHRRMQYFKPKLAAKGVGIKRGLTAVEAAILLERPLDKVLAMIVFGMLKKGFIRIKSQDPLRFEKPTVDKPEYHSYEKKFIKSLDPTGKPSTFELKKCMISLIENVQDKMKGFNIRQTRNYYENIVDTAWKHVQMADMDNSVEWAMVDKDFDKKLGDVFPEDRPIYTPTWWPYYHRGYYGRGYASGTPAGTGSGKATLSFKQFSNSVASGFESFSNNVVSSAESFASGVTAVTNPIPQSSGGSFSGGGGGGGSCACACAGCACACAGGGR